MLRAMSSAPTGLMSTPSLAASARSSASRWAVRNAACSARARSFGTPGGAANGRAMVRSGVSASSINARAAAVGKLARGRHLGQLGVPRDARKLQQDVEAAVGLEPLRPVRLDRGEIEGPSIDLAALDREEDRGRVGITEHLLDIEPERVAQ